MEYIIVDRKGGGLVSYGEDHPDVAAQQARIGQLMLPFPSQAIERQHIEGFTALRPGISQLRPLLYSLIDKEAGDFASQFVTTLPGEVSGYAEQHAEATSWQPDSPDSAYPFMVAQASLRGVPVQQVRDEILARVATVRPVIAAITAHRVAAKQAVREAGDAGAAIRAACLAWADILPTN